MYIIINCSFKEAKFWSITTFFAEASRCILQQVFLGGVKKFFWKLLAPNRVHLNLREQGLILRWKQFHVASIFGRAVNRNLSLEGRSCLWSSALYSPTSFRGWSLSSDANGSLDSSTRRGLHSDMVKIWGKMQVNGPSVLRLPDYRHHFTPFRSQKVNFSPQSFSLWWRPRRNTPGENLKILRKYIQKSGALHLGRNIFCFRLSALIDYTSTSDEIISLTDLIKSAKLRRVERRLLGRRWAPRLCFAPTLIQKWLLQPVKHCSSATRSPN